MLAAIGDSKTRGQTCCVATDGYRSMLIQDLASVNVKAEWAGVLAQDSCAIDCLRALIDAWILTVPVPPSWVLLNTLGEAVDDETSFKADLAYILDACHTAWPNAKVRVAKMWRKAPPDKTVNYPWIDSVVSSRSSWAAVGINEQTLLENGDDGATYMPDGVHPNAAGYAVTAAGWQVVLGF